jgi:Family of unknown function (DUF695)
MNPNSSSPAIGSGTEELEWVIAEGRTAEYPYELRFCKIPVNFPRSQYPVRLNIFWSMASPRQDGLASPEDIQRMHVFEERVVAATENQQIAMLPLVLTGKGQREFVFFARSSEKFLQALSHMPQEDARYPIEIHQSDDATWTYYENEIGAVK